MLNENCECGNPDFINNHDGFIVCGNCGLTLDEKILFESSFYPKEQSSKEKDFTDIDRTYQKIHLKKGTYPKKKIANFELLDDYLNLLNLTSEQRYKLKDLFIDSKIEGYKKMMLFAMKAIILLKYNVEFDALIKNVKRVSQQNNVEIIKLFTFWYYRNVSIYNQITYKSINAMIHVVKFPIKVIYKIGQNFLIRINFNRVSDEEFYARKLQAFLLHTISEIQDKKNRPNL